MYCSTCGAEATLDVHYCKRCGSSLNAQTAVELRPVSINGPSWAMAVTVISMLAIIFSALIKFAEIGLSAVAITWIAIAGLGTVVALVAMIFRQLSHIMSARQQAQLPAAPAKSNTTSELYAGGRGSLPEPVPSVTEHTTRTFEPVYREPVERRK
ncbi:MAG: zinc ribbon domain-containing protein [Acidobacteria bacterium]|nr:zinc ribbon domain-containing protein [Acidobacteriota bacterium]